MQPIKSILSLIAALVLATAALAAPVTVAFDSTFNSSFVDKGVPSARATLITAAGVGYQSFGFEAKAYAPTVVSTNGKNTLALNRVDVTGSYTFTSSLLDVAIGDTQKHYNAPGKTGEGDHNQPFVKLTAKDIPLSLVARYDIATRNLNTEANAKLFTFPTRLVDVTPSVYIGYSDIADQFPHSLKAVKRADRYYGGGIGLSRKVLGGTLAAGGYVNQMDHGVEGRTLFWTVGYSLKR
jgi:hypothetical protein